MGQEQRLRPGGHKKTIKLVEGFSEGEGEKLARFIKGTVRKQEKIQSDRDESGCFQKKGTFQEMVGAEQGA